MVAAIDYIVINEIKQKDLIIEGYKKRQRQNRSTAIRIDDTDNERLSASSFGSMQNSYVHLDDTKWGLDSITAMPMVPWSSAFRSSEPCQRAGRNRHH